MNTEPVAIMQIDGAKFESWFLLQKCSTVEAAKELAFKLAAKRNAAKKDYPKWSVRGITY